VSSTATSSQRQVARLLALLPYLQDRPGARVPDVAAAFGISSEQLIADLRVLWFCGLPGLAMGDLIEVDMEAVEGSGRITVSNADYLARPLRLDAVEATALLVAVRTLADTTGAADRDAVDRVLAKLEAVASAGAADRSAGPGRGAGARPARGAGRRAETAPGRPSAGELPRHQETEVPVEVRVAPAGTAEVLVAVRTALADQRVLHLVYEGAAADRRTERDVDPRRLRFLGDAAYLDAWCRVAGADRSFRVARISAATVLDAAFDPPPQEAAADPGAAYHPTSSDVVVTLELVPSARWVAEYHPVLDVAERPGGGLRVRLAVADTRFLVRLVLRLGGGARVVAPPEVAEQVREAAAAGLAAYQDA